MSILLKNYKEDLEHLGKLKKLYLTAFPKEERAPFFLMKSKAKKGKGEMLSVTDGDIFVGLVYMVCYRDLAYIFYLAIDESLRGKGYGSQVLGAVKQRYKGKRIFLAREQLDKRADNYEQRLKRHQFYLRNGFIDLPCCIKEASVIYDVMGIGGNILAEEYDILMTGWLGWLLCKLIDMRLIKKNMQ